ncbi:hypothetical protein [Streptomyces zingiberis]|uniref:Secreted protein n=1 Tax=Streptomyces zingiberis TaxID=2053010 RepID=A0ABX1BT56_9ACTN|nr:hypothetical protein [Streptomyces zingiberis]NJQ00278.1 hypothetical protein [Streptomyces zingiberis]
MRIASRFLAITALSAIAIGGVTSASRAEHPSRTKISPYLPEAGSPVVVSVTSRCADRRMTAESQGLSREITLHRDGRHRHVGSGTVREHVRPGRSYPVRARCRSGDEPVTGHFTVGHHTWRGVRAGAGGAGAGGPDAGTVAAGTAVMGLVAGGSVMALRRRSGRA